MLPPVSGANLSLSRDRSPGGPGPSRDRQGAAHPPLPGGRGSEKARSRRLRFVYRGRLAVRLALAGGRGLAGPQQRRAAAAAAEAGQEDDPPPVALLEQPLQQE